jgi:hypothetical protein
MEEKEIFLLSQLVNSLIRTFNELQEAYSKKDKENFDRSKQAITETQGKINFLLKDY